MSQSYVLAVHGGAGTILPGSPNEAPYHLALVAAAAAGESVLRRGGSALDAVSASVVALEDCPLFNAGHGAIYTMAGTNQMEASLMDGSTLAAGAAAGLRTVRNPILLARAVMEKTAHVFLIGEGAEEFARSCGLNIEPPEYFATTERFEQWQRLRNVGIGVMLDHDAANNTGPDSSAPIDPDTKFGTVGAVARDRAGNLAAATSTGGLTNQMPGRVGDSPIVGAGNYANNRTVAVSATGTGEYFLRSVLAYDISARMEYGGLSLAEATQQAIFGNLSDLGGKGGVIAIDRDGNLSLPFNTMGMYRAWVREGCNIETAIGKVR